MQRLGCLNQHTQGKSLNESRRTAMPCKHQSAHCFPCYTAHFFVMPLSAFLHKCSSLFPSCLICFELSFLTNGDNDKETNLMHETSACAGRRDQWCLLYLKELACTLLGIMRISECLYAGTAFILNASLCLKCEQEPTLSRWHAITRISR